jgi:hypothetical protein
LISKGNFALIHRSRAESGRERIFVKCSRPEDNKAWQLEFDTETKLLISLKQWQTSDFKGFPQFDVRKIVYYENLPDEIFEIELPDSSEIISVNIPLNDPNYGMSAEGLTEEQSIYKILEEFWQAAIERDYDRVRKLMSYLVNKTDKQLDDMLGSNEGLSE